MRIWELEKEYDSLISFVKTGRAQLLHQPGNIGTFTGPAGGRLGTVFG